MVKIGLEMHQQLNTGKLFCRCSGKLSDEIEFTFKRTLRPVLSEMGQIDRAALLEARRGREMTYYANTKTSCAVEWDEEPPHKPDEEAVRIATQISLALNATLVDEVYFMRKILIDGSAVGGFQRTSLIATGGDIDGIAISMICLEEDSARPTKKGFNLDRLGVPLIEVATEPVITSGEQAKKVAKKIGTLFRMANVRRGLGTIRQDLNVSIPEGARVEIKGVQDLDSMPILVDFEVERQENLVKLKSRLCAKFTSIKDVSSAFKKTKNKIFKDKEVYACIMKDSSGLFAESLHKNKPFGKEIAEYVKSFRYKGFIHSDENMKKYKIENEFKEVKKLLNAKKDDLIIMSAGTKTILDLVKERVIQLSKGVSEDTRKAKEDGSTEYMRPLPTGARMYPETDIMPFLLPKTKPLEKPEQRLERLSKILPSQIASKLYLSPDYFLFEKLGGTKLAGIIITEHLPALRRKKLIVTEKHLKTVLELVNNKKLTKGGIVIALETLVKGKKIEVETVDISDIEKFIKKVIKEKSDYVSKSRDPIKGIMGIVMAKYRGKIPGKIIMAKIKKELK